MYRAEYYQKNKEKILKQNKEWREKNKEKIYKQKKEYNEKNKQRDKEWFKQNAQKPEVKKKRKISQWKKRGLIHDDYSKLYDDYLENTECEECRVTYGVIGDGTGTFKCMDHDHNTGLFRNFLCNGCNIRRG